MSSEISIEGPSSSPVKGSFSIANLSLKAQKKIASRLSSRNLTKIFLPEAVNKLFDRLYDVLKEYYPKAEAEKVVKNMIKIASKICVLGRNGLLTSEDEGRLDLAHKRVRTLAVTTVSFSKIAYSYDREYYLGILDTVKEAMDPLVEAKLSDKSHARLDHIFEHLSNPKILDALFQHNGPHLQELNDIAAAFESLIETEDL